MVRPSSTVSNRELDAAPCVRAATCAFAGAPPNKQPLATHAARVQKLTLAACVASGCLFGGAPAKAQVAARTQGAASNSRLLTVEEGRTIADAARDQDRPRHSAQDCSHLVHQA